MLKLISEVVLIVIKSVEVEVSDFGLLSKPIGVGDLLCLRLRYFVVSTELDKLLQRMLLVVALISVYCRVREITDWSCWAYVHPVILHQVHVFGMRKWALIFAC